MSKRIMTKEERQAVHRINYHLLNPNQAWVEVGHVICVGGKEFMIEGKNQLKSLSGE